jgi:hypothetical protein
MGLLRGTPGSRRVLLIVQQGPGLALIHEAHALRQVAHLVRGQRPHAAIRRARPLQEGTNHAVVIMNGDVECISHVVLIGVGATIPMDLSALVLRQLGIPF